MDSQSIRPAYAEWPLYNQRLRDAVAPMTAEQLAIQPASDRWPLWATVDHLACQRVFWLCDFAGEPGADTTPFTNAGFDCPGDDDLEHVLSAEALDHALESTFRIIQTCLDTWTLEMLDEEIRPESDPTRVHRRGWVLQRVFAHDIWHAAEVNETLARHGLRQIDFWD
jgi:uncharacterized damage-inducible protein DinB